MLPSLMIYARDDYLGISYWPGMKTILFFIKEVDLKIKANIFITIYIASHFPCTISNTLFYSLWKKFTVFFIAREYGKMNPVSVRGFANVYTFCLGFIIIRRT